MTAAYTRMLDLEGRGFVVLGSGYGIGREISRALTANGATVLCADRDLAVAQEVANEVHGQAIHADVTNEASINAVFSRANELFGAQFSGFVDIVGLAIIKPLAELDRASWDLCFNQTLNHAYIALRAAAPLLKANGRGGSIAFIGSLSGLLTFRNQLAYGTAKAALHHLVRLAAYDLAPHGIRVNAVAPGFVKTPDLLSRTTPEFWKSVDSSIPLGRAAVPGDVASALLYLLTPLSAYLTGNVLVLDGALQNTPACPAI